MTAKDPRERPPSSAIAAEDLEEIMLDLIGPRWRRDARLPEPPEAAPRREPPASGEWESFEFKPAATGSDESTMLAGIDVEGTGPDTGAEMPTALTREAATPPPPATTTRMPPDTPATTRMPAETPTPEPAGPAAETARRRSGAEPPTPAAGRTAPARAETPRARGRWSAAPPRRASPAPTPRPPRPGWPAPAASRCSRRCC